MKLRSAERGVWNLSRRLALAALVAVGGTIARPAAAALSQPDWRNITNGFQIPSAGYSDQAYVVITRDGNWLAVLTTGKGREGDAGQHVASSLSSDQGRTWSPLYPIELLEGLWTQGELTKRTRVGRVLDAGERQLKRQSIRLPTLPNLADRGGFTLEFQVRFDVLSPGQVLLDTRGASGKGLVVQTTAAPAVELVLSDGTLTNQWRCDTGLLTTDKTHHVGIVLDGGPRLITFVMDGVVGDGGAERQFGWGRFSPALGDVNAEREARLAPTLRGRLLTLRVYDRYLRNSELIANYHASLRKRSNFAGKL